MIFFKAIAHALNTKVYCDTRKSSILRCQGDSDLDAMLTSNPTDAIVHLVPLSTITTDRLKIYLDRFKGSFNKIVGFRPTGWTYVIDYTTLSRSCLLTFSTGTAHQQAGTRCHLSHQLFLDHLRKNLHVQIFSHPASRQAQYSFIPFHTQNIHLSTN